MNSPSVNPRYTFLSKVTGCCCTFVYHAFFSAVTIEGTFCLNSTYTRESLVFLSEHDYEQNKVRKKRQRKIIWFNPPFNLDVSTNVAKIFLNLIEKHFPRSSKLHKIFNKNIIKVSYSCTQNMSQIIKGHNKDCSERNTRNSRV